MGFALRTNRLRRSFAASASPGRAFPLGLLLSATLFGAAALPGCGAFSSGPKGDPELMAESEVDLAADLWFREHRPREALKHGLRAVDLDSENADAHHLVALIYLDFCQNSRIDECRLGEAEKHAREAVSHREKFHAAENTLAVILIHRKQYDKAIAVLKPLTEDMLYPTPELAWGNLGWAKLEKGDAKGAIPDLRRAVAAQPLFCVGNYRLGVAWHQVGKLDSALDALDRALETDAPGCDALQDAYLERARVHTSLGEDEMARNDFDRCLSLDRRNEAGKECAKLLRSL